MAFHLRALVSNCNFIKYSKGISNRSNLHFIGLQARKFVSTAKLVFDEKVIVRRSANYHPPIWDYDYVQSLQSDYQGESCDERANKLTGEVKMMMLDEVRDPLEKLELVDTLQRLGLSHHFENETKRILESTVRADFAWKKDNLYGTALEFRLLRQHGYDVTQEVFSSFMDEAGNFKGEDYKGLLNLYEASYLFEEDENVLENARDFAIKHLRKYLMNNKGDENLPRLVARALELPLHWRIPKLEARWFIDMYERKEDRNQILLELAKLDFNMVQAVHQADLRYASKWWRDIGLSEKLSFARDRLMECFLWSAGLISDRQFGYCRIIVTKIIALITIIDDIYDVYGTLEELQLFTEAVKKWEIHAMQQLPDYMKICFLALYNTVNEMAFDILKEQGFDTIPYLKEMWADLCESYLLEAKWYYSRYVPTLSEYMDNGKISIGTALVLIHAYVATNSITKEGLEFFKQDPNIVSWAARIFRLQDDLGTSSDELQRGDVSKSIQCYMHETGATEEEAREHTRKLVEAAWKKMNKDRISNSPLPKAFIQTVLNFTRMSHWMYQHGDGHGVEDCETKDRVLSTLVQPIPV